MAYTNQPCKCDKSLNGVYCEVTGCAYHGNGNTCHAENIKVQDPSASRKSETFCATFVNQKNV